jgi:hypothetical protein
MSNVMCGGMVNCKGGCSVAYTAPECEVALMPPSCNVNANCEANCKSQASMSATCTPPSVTYQCSATVSSGLQAVITALQTYLPPLLNAAEVQGKLALSAAGTLVSTGQAEFSSIGSLTGQAFACAGTAVSGSVSAQANISVSVMASASVSGMAGAM